MTEHPAYKDHPLWLSAMEIVHRSYELASAVRSTQPLVARHLRKAAVAVPAHLAEAIAPPGGRSMTESLAACRGALAETERQASQAASSHPIEGQELARAVRELEGRIILEFYKPETHPC